jgi:ribosomal protein L11 methylase PrmA
MSLPINIHPASFRDPAGFIFKRGGKFYRLVCPSYKAHYEYAVKNGLFKEAIEKKILLPFEETDAFHPEDINHYKTLLPRQIPFFTYPWEWSFEQLKEAAIVSISLCRLALQNGMILKDATPLNLQFIEGRFQWIDHLSFEIYESGNTWIAYRQFCEMFLNPLLIASQCGMETHRIMHAYPNGISSMQTARLLPWKNRWNMHIQLHVFLQAKMQRKQTKSESKKQNFSAHKIQRILDSLETCIRSLSYQPSNSEWSHYYEESILSKEYLQEKKTTLKQLLENIPYQTVFDAGCNDGAITELCKAEAWVAAADSDSVCIDNLFGKIQKNKITNISPFVLDLTQPSGGMGWDNKEQLSFTERKEFDLVLALALIHHLAIGKNVPMDKIADLYARIGKELIIEFVPKEDPKVMAMLANRKDIFDHYNRMEFEKIFSQYFSFSRVIESALTKRIIYYMIRK